MNSTTIVLTGVIVLLAAIICVLAFTQKSPEPAAPAAASGDPVFFRQLQLQAYERLTLLIDRIALPNLISRVNLPGVGARDMQQLLVQNIKQEFDYNITQQVYVSADAWNAVKNLKEQNQLIINQYANTLPANATGLDLNKLLLEYAMTDKKGMMHEVVSEVLSYEAKSLLV